jgi:hypothetical protein
MSLLNMDVGSVICELRDLLLRNSRFDKEQCAIYITVDVGMDYHGMLLMAIQRVVMKNVAHATE